MCAIAANRPQNDGDDEHDEASDVVRRWRGRRRGRCRLRENEGQVSSLECRTRTGGEVSGDQGQSKDTRHR